MPTSTHSGTLLLTDLESAVRAGWGRDTCDPADLADWRPDNPSRGQCGVTALVLHDLLGGDLLVADVQHASGQRQGYHYWNRLSGGVEIDLTREQFTDGEVIDEPTVATRPPGPPNRCRRHHELLRTRVLSALRLHDEGPERIRRAQSARPLPP